MIRRAGGLVVVENGRILMVERRKEKGKIAIPGGKLEPGEYAVEAAIRETYEETSLVCHVPYEDNCFFHHDVDGFAFTAFRGKVVAGTLMGSLEGTAFWLDLRCLKNLPSVLRYPEWTAEAIKFFRL